MCKNRQKSEDFQPVKQKTERHLNENYVREEFTLDTKLRPNNTSVLILDCGWQEQINTTVQIFNYNYK